MRLDCRLGPTLSCLVAEKKLNSQITTFLSQQQIPLIALPLPLLTTVHFLNILLLKLCLFLPQTYLLELHHPNPDLIQWHCCCGGKVAIWEFSFFLLPSKTEWALVYCPEQCVYILNLAVHTL